MVAVLTFRACLIGFLSWLVPAPAPQSELVIVKEGTTLYHRPHCPVVREGKGVLALARTQADARGFTSHRDCDPTVMPTAPRGTTSGARPAAPQFVFVAEGRRQYHREDCAKLPAPRRKLLLEEAGKTYWPCPVCKPPIRRKGDGPAVPKQELDG